MNIVSIYYKIAFISLHTSETINLSLNFKMEFGISQFVILLNQLDCSSDNAEVVSRESFKNSGDSIFIRQLSLIYCKT